MKPFKQYVLENGLRVVLVPQKNSLAATILVLVNTGSFHETKKINGLAHIIEHLCFKGTKKRPSFLEVTQALESLGAIHNAFTTEEVTGYFAKVGATNVLAALEIVADLYVNPLFPEKELEKEKPIVIEEIKMRYEDAPMNRAQFLLYELMYGDQPAGWPVAGTKESVQGATIAAIQQYRDQHYTASNTVVVVSGAFSEQQVKRDIKKLFSTIKKGTPAQKISVQESQQAPQSKVFYKETGQTSLVIGFRAFSMFDERRHVLRVLTKVLGGSMSSRLFVRIREELGAAYDVGADAELFTSHGIWEVYAGVDHDKLAIVIQSILKELKRMTQELVPAEELERVKNYMIGRVLLGLETSDALGEFYGEQALLRKDITMPQEIIQRIKRVTAKEIQVLAKELFKNSGLNCAVVGPLKELPTGVTLKI